MCKILGYTKRIHLVMSRVTAILHQQDIHAELTVPYLETIQTHLSNNEN